MSLSRRLVASAVGRMKSVRESPLLSPVGLFERWAERGTTPPAVPVAPALVDAAVDWLIRAQDATPDDGIPRGYSLRWNRVFRSRGWQPSYPEATGYIIPTLYALARELGRPDLATRAERAARWEIQLQLPTGAVQAGVVGETRSPSVFNTGQVMLGWLSAFEETGDGAFADACRGAGRFLVAMLDPVDHHWYQGNSPLALQSATRYNSRTAWALAEAGVRLEEPEFVQAAARQLRAVIAEQPANGWLPRCCLTDPDRPLLHTLAYGISGILGGGLVLQDAELIAAASTSAEHLAATVDQRGWMPGRFHPDWSAAVAWSCLTGQAQMAEVWLRLHSVSGRADWLGPVLPVLGFIESTRNLSSGNAGLRGGIKGSSPLGGGYAPYEMLSWAVKFYLDAALRYRWITQPPVPPPNGRGGSGSLLG